MASRLGECADSTPATVGPQMSAMQGNAEACFALWELLGEAQGGLPWLEQAALRQHEEAARVFIERGCAPKEQSSS